MTIFATQITALNAKTQTQHPLSGNGLLGEQTLDGVDFWQFILGKIETAEIKNDLKSENSAQDNLQSAVENEKADLALLQLALIGQDTDQSIEDHLHALKQKNLELTQGNRVTQLTKLIDHLTSGLPQQAIDQGNLEALVHRLSQRLEKLESSLDAFRTGDFGEDGAPFKLLIATGLNPAQLTKITQRIEEVETKLGRPLTVEDLIAGVGNIIPAAGDKDHEFAAPDALALLIEPDDIDIPPEEIISEDFISKELMSEVSDYSAAIDTTNVIDTEIAPADFQTIVSLPAQSFAKQIQASKNIISPVAESFARDSSAIDAESLEGGFIPVSETARSNAEFQTLMGGTNAALKGHTKATPMIAVALAQKIDATGLEKSALDGQILLSGIESLSKFSASGFADFDIQTGLPFTQSGQAAHFISSPSVAGHPHPATKTIALQIHKAANTGKTDAMTLHLDPPELGRVEIRLEFGKEKSVKAHLIVEKPETLLMLQRDAGSLEKALQDAGLDTGRDSLNYQMASEDHAFQSGKDNQNTGAGKTGTKLESIEESIFESSMSWDVDPETGHVHYSILT